MKKRKIALLVILSIALIMALALGACNAQNSDSSSSPLLPTGGPEDSSSSQSEDSAPQGSGGSDSAGGNLPGDDNGGVGTPAPDANAPSTPEGPGPHSFTGTIVDAGMGKFLLEVEGGYSLQVEYHNADISGLADSRPGAAVVVTYTGELNGTDTGGITVVSVANP